MVCIIKYPLSGPSSNLSLVYICTPTQFQKYFRVRHSQEEISSEAAMEMESYEETVVTRNAQPEVVPNSAFYSPSIAFHMPLRPYSGQTLVSVGYEVFGIVQGVFFPKFCRDMAQSLGLKGWVRNTRRNTIQGVMQGEKDRVDDMAMWLRLQGSPGSRIEHTVFTNWTIIDGHDFKEFRILY